MQKRMMCAVILAVMFLMAGCNSHNEIEVPWNGLGDAETGAIITVGMSKEDVESQFEERTVNENSLGEIKGKTTYSYDGASIMYNSKDEVFGITINSDADNWETQWGIKLGSEKDEITKSYGEGRENDHGWYNYSHDGLILRVKYEDDKVASISLNSSSMGDIL